MHSFLLRRGLVLPLVLSAAALLLLSSALAAPAEQSTACFNAPVSADPTPTVCIARVLAQINSTSPDNQFVVSWRSQKAEKGRVVLTSGETFDDVRGANYQGKTHYVAVNNLNAKTTYQFDIQSGNSTFTNNGAHWSAKLGAPVQQTTPYTIFGRVKNPDGSDADNVIVIAQVRDGDKKGTTTRSALLSALIVLADGGDFFNINLDEARIQNNGQKYIFNPDTDKVLITAIGAQGSASQVFKISDLHPPAPPPSLILNANGSGSAVTATPTILEPTITPTASPTLTETPTLPLPTEPPEPPTDTPVPTETATREPILELVTPTIMPAEETQIAENEVETAIALPVGDEIEPPQPTRVSRGVPNVLAPVETNNNSNVIFIVLAVVLLVGAGLLGLAAYFVTRR
ncbi:MAG TPA: hypothetical protein VFD70_01090 [Anaerolineae bacterium]|nr:hypothetical protein [Anaerolineae bacterium]